MKCWTVYRIQLYLNIELSKGILYEIQLIHADRLLYYSGPNYCAWFYIIPTNQKSGPRARHTGRETSARTREATALWILILICVNMYVWSVAILKSMEKVYMRFGLFLVLCIGILPCMLRIHVYMDNESPINCIYFSFTGSSRRFENFCNSCFSHPLSYWNDVAWTKITCSALKNNLQRIDILAKKLIMKWLQCGYHCVCGLYDIIVSPRSIETPHSKLSKAFKVLP